MSPKLKSIPKIIVLLSFFLFPFTLAAQQEQQKVSSGPRDSDEKESIRFPETLMYLTVRIETKSANGKSGIGTGFFFRFAEQGTRSVPAIVTNKHVVRDAEEGTIYITLADKENRPLSANYVPIHFTGFEKNWVQHPNNAVDLCVLPIAPLLRQAKQKGERLFYIPCTKSLIPDAEAWNHITILENVLMIGYPAGVWDKKHNLPIVRMGVTAFHPAIDYNNRDEFLIDIACYRGSSGSPVFLYDPIKSRGADGRYDLGRGTLKLIGILYGGFEYTSEGEIVFVDVPTRLEPRSKTRIPLNLGGVIKANKLLDFDDLLMKLAIQDKEN